MRIRRLANWLVGRRRRWLVSIHVDEDGLYWAESPTHPEWSGGDETLAGLLDLIDEAGAVWWWGRACCLIDAEAVHHELQRRIAP